ncbi:MAG: hypothetical protein ABH877_04575 [bacterium]
MSEKLHSAIAKLEYLRIKPLNLTSKQVARRWRMGDTRLYVLTGIISTLLLILGLSMSAPASTPTPDPRWLGRAVIEREVPVDITRTEPLRICYPPPCPDKEWRVVSDPTVEIGLRSDGVVVWREAR